MARSVFNGVPYGYTRIGDTDVYYKFTDNGFDIVGGLNGQYYGSTFSDAGYRVALQVDDSSAGSVLSSGINNISGIETSLSLEQQGIFARITLTLRNTTDTSHTVSAGVYADVMIGNNDRAPIQRRVDMLGDAYGLTMSDSGGAQLCVLFGSGLVGVKAVDKFWFGNYGVNSEPAQIVGNYVVSSNYMVENGSYDSAMGWCWRERVIPAGESIQLSYLMGVGDVNLEPNSSFEVTPDNPELWNDLSLPHTIAISGEYESPAGQQGRIEYAVEDSEEWLPLTDMLDSGAEFSSKITVTFTPGLDLHQVRFRTVDAVGNTASLRPIVYKDISAHRFDGIGDLTYSGYPLLHKEVTSDLSDNEFTLVYAGEHTEVGDWSVSVEGVFPATIGRKRFDFSILPAPLPGYVQLDQSEYVYTGQYCTPSYYYFSGVEPSPEEGRDYEVRYYDNLNAGQGRLALVGRGNYTGEVIAPFNISKADITDSMYCCYNPDHDGRGVTYDGKEHEMNVEVFGGGMGDYHVKYLRDGEEMPSGSLPVEEGEYICLLSFDEGDNFNAMELRPVGSFSIYRFDEQDWDLLCSLYPKLREMGYSHVWDISDIRNVGTFGGLDIRNGRVESFNASYPEKTLSGEMPEELLMFGKLESLSLANQNISGDIDAICDAALGRLGKTTLSEALRYVDLDNNALTGNIGRMIDLLPALENIRAVGNSLTDCSPSVRSGVSADLSGQIYYENIPLHLASFNGLNIFGIMPPILTESPLMNDGKPMFRGLLTPVDAYGAVDKPIGYASVSLDIDPEGIGGVRSVGDYVLKIPSGQQMALKISGASVNGYVRSVKYPVTLDYEAGDANFDGYVNTGDLRSLVLYIFDTYRMLGLPFNYNAADLYTDEPTSVINVQDIVRLTDIIITRDVWDSASGLGRSRAQSRERTASAIVTLSDGKLRLESDAGTGAFDILLPGATSFTPSAALKNSGFTIATRLSDRGVRIVGYSATPAALPAGRLLLGSVSGETGTAYAEIADADGNVSYAEANGDVTGVETPGQGGVTVSGRGDGIRIVAADGHEFRWQLTDMTGAVISSGSAKGETTLPARPGALILVVDGQSFKLKL